MKRQPSEWEKIIANKKTDEELISKIYKQLMQLKKQQLEPGMEQQTGTKLGKKYVKAIHCYTDYLISMQSTSCKMTGWKKQKLKSRLPEEISITSDMQMTPPLWQKVKRN